APPETTMPIDMALPLYLSTEDFVYRTPPNSCSPALSSSLRFQPPQRVEPAPDVGHSSAKDTRKAKKQVTFADHRVYVKDTYPSSYSDTFSFEVSLPAELPPHERVEFAVCYEVGGRQHWDSNWGDNYRVVWSSMKSHRQDAVSHRTNSFDFGIHFDRYGSPTCSHGIFPDWPSYAGYEDIGPYY
ncbi:protein phosphatase 1 regulatory subunit 3B-like, partial [Seriola lalandi dorsalis]|uniref:protein phosphatase 1 regulatory subunit 3B-like n=1 Tax=Seriola lalandi dorsalis TaxID=1841481 RepID=UPI000C6F7EDA